jgi:hypothetical protein
MLLGLGTGETEKKTIRQIAKNLKTCGGHFSCLIPPKSRTASCGGGAAAGGGGGSVASGRDAGESRE